MIVFESEARLDDVMEKYLVLGGQGFIGTALVNFLRKNGHAADSIDFKLNPKNDLKTLKIENLDKYDGCFFLAWNVGGSKYLGKRETWRDQFSENISLMHNIFPQLAKSGIPFLFVSSQLAGSDDSPYSLTKLLGENYAQTFQNAVVARQWNAYGSIETKDLKSHVISDMILQAVSDKRIRLLTDGVELRKFIHLEDICRAYLTLIKNHLGGVFDVSAGDFISILEVAQMIARETDAKVIPGIAIGNNPRFASSPKIPNWEPGISLETGIKDLIMQAARNPIHT